MDKSLVGPLLEECNEIVADMQNVDACLKKICELLEVKVSYYEWVGFYLVDPNKERELVLGPYVGDKTDHTNISFGEGICGQAADTKETFVIQDVSKEDNYLSCSLNVKSEIVVPIMRGNTVLGELDIDSHDVDPFTDYDSELLEKICEMVEPLL